MSAKAFNPIEYYTNSLLLMRKFISVILILTLLLPATLSADMGKPTAPKTNLSDMETTTLTGEAVDGSIFSQHTLTVLHYFATWSADCIRELDYMQQAQEAFGSQIAVLGVLHEDGTSTAEACLELFAENGITYPAVHLCDRLSALVGQNSYIPQTFIVDSGGNVVSSFIGTFEDYSVLESLILDLLPNDTLYHTVNFYDGLTGMLIAAKHVVHGGSARPPHPPVHEGYEFVEWKGNYTNVLNDENVEACYQEVVIVVPVLPGDVNGDGAVDVTDATLIIRYSLDLISDDNDFIVDAADYNMDGHIEVGDAILVIRFSMGLD